MKVSSDFSLLSLCDTDLRIFINHVPEKEKKIIHLIVSVLSFDICFWAHLCICMGGSYAYCVCLSVCLSVTWPKFILDKKSCRAIQNVYCQLFEWNHEVMLMSCTGGFSLCYVKLHFSLLRLPIKSLKRIKASAELLSKSFLACTQKNGTCFLNEHPFTAVILLSVLPPT